MLTKVVMCNLYSMTRNQEAIRPLFRVCHDLAGNLPPLPAIFPDMMAVSYIVSSSRGTAGRIGLDAQDLKWAK
jgi:hypothetical protein